jgi:hypothetical protein
MASILRENSVKQQTELPFGKKKLIRISFQWPACRIDRDRSGIMPFSTRALLESLPLPPDGKRDEAALLTMAG